MTEEASQGNRYFERSTGQCNAKGDRGSSQSFECRAEGTQNQYPGIR